MLHILVARPSHHLVAIARPSHHLVAIARPSHHLVAIARPSHHLVAIARPSHHLVAIARPSHHLVAIARPSHHLVASFDLLQLYPIFRENWPILKNKPTIFGMKLLLMATYCRNCLQVTSHARPLLLMATYLCCVMLSKKH